LDFGSTEKSSIVGDSYPIHGRLFVMDSQGQVIQQIAPPANFTSWNYPEWGAMGDVAVAVARDGQELGKSIFAVNLKSGSLLELVRGDDFSYPWLWVREGVAEKYGLNDSLGRYNKPVGTAVKDMYGMRMLAFWSHPEATFFIVGNSQAAMDFDPAIFSDPGYNMGIPSTDISTTYDIVMNYVAVNANGSPLRWVGIFVPLDNMLYDPSLTSWVGSIEDSQGRIYDAHHDFWRAGLPANFLTYLGSLARPQVYLDIRPEGLSAVPSLGWGKPPKNVWPAGLGRNSRNVAEPIRMINSMVTTLSEKGISTVLLIPPVHPWYSSDIRFGPTGMKDDLATSILNALDSICALHTSAWVYDANQWGKHDYTDSDAYDYQHLSATGAAKLATRVREFLIEKGVQTK
jgi:hypothetical protein